MNEGTLKTPIPKCRLYWFFVGGRCSNFVGSESGQKRCTFTLGRGGGVGEVREKVEGQQYTSWVKNTNHERMYFQSIKSVKHMPQSPLTGQF